MPPTTGWLTGYWGDLSESNRLIRLHRPVSQPFDLEHHDAPSFPVGAHTSLFTRRPCLPRYSWHALQELNLYLDLRRVQSSPLNERRMDDPLGFEPRLDASKASVLPLNERSLVAEPRSRTEFLRLMRPATYRLSCPRWHHLQESNPYHEFRRLVYFPLY